LKDENYPLPSEKKLTPRGTSVDPPGRIFGDLRGPMLQKIVVGGQGKKISCKTT
jgi:hypothetical protein